MKYSVLLTDIRYINVEADTSKEAAAKAKRIAEEQGMIDPTIDSIELQ
jgi:hypothetical protein